MKKLLVLMLILVAFAIGCGNTDPNEIDDNTPMPMPEDSPVYNEVTVPGVDATISKKVNVALNEVVKKLGDLTGYKQFAYTEIYKSARSTRAEPDGEIRKVYIKDGSVKTVQIYFYKASGDTVASYIGVYSLGVEVTGFTVNYYNSDSSSVVDKGVVPASEYAGYKMYDAVLTDYRVKLGTDDWLNNPDGAIGTEHPLLIKIESKQYSQTSGGGMEKNSATANNYKLFVYGQSPYAFIDQVVTARSF